MDAHSSRRCRAARSSRIWPRSPDSSAAAWPFPLEWRDRMAKKKPRTPTPPRRVQAPQRRVDAPDPAARHRMLLYGISGAGIVALVVVVLIVALAGGGSNAKAAIKTIRAQGCQ